MKNLNQTKNYLTEEINQNELMSEKHNKVYGVLNYIECLLILIFTVTRCIYISSFASLVGFPIGIKNSAIALKICVKTSGIKKCEWITEKKEKKSISHNEFVLIYNVPKDFDDINEEIGN